VPEEAVRGGHLREDLYYRLNVFQVHMPPLRDRRSDIPALAEALLAELNRKHECRVVEISPAVRQTLEGHNWPGNVRELRNVIERAVILAGEGTIERKHLPAFLQGAASPVTAADAVADEPDAVRFAVGTTVEEAEKGLILRTLEHTHNNKTRAAEILDISLKTLHNKLKEYAGAKGDAAAGT
jgi:DNA-binding NtrC family response regulator